MAATGNGTAGGGANGGGRRRVGIFGWGIVAPRSANVEEFAANLTAGGSWLEPFEDFGPNNFLVGLPKCDFADYRGWFDERHAPNRYPRLVEKMDPTTLFAVAAFIQALGQNPGLEDELRRLGDAAHVYVGTGLGALPTVFDQSIAYHRAWRRWNYFWAQPERNAALTRYLEDGEPPAGAAPDAVPRNPSEVVRGEGRNLAEETWDAFWTERSALLAEYLDDLEEIESIGVTGDVEAGKRKVLREKQRRHLRLRDKYGAPDPPWAAVSPNLLWNIHNTPASQISIAGGITGAAFAPAAACSTFGVSLKLAIDAIRRGEAKAVVMGATDPPPHPLTVSAFFNARVLAAHRGVSKPLSELRGTHVSGGAALWIVGDWEHMTARGFRPLGLEPLAVGVTSDADHIITPSKQGPQQAIRAALAAAAVSPADVAGWDQHATATPGDYLEVENLRELLPESVLVTARKGTFGHGMGASGGWELTAQYLGYAEGRLAPTPLAEGELNEMIGGLHRRFVFDAGCAATGSVVGKLSMGVGGINACVVSRPWG